MQSSDDIADGYQRAVFPCTGQLAPWRKLLFKRSHMWRVPGGTPAHKLHIAMWLLDIQTSVHIRRGCLFSALFDSIAFTNMLSLQCNNVLLFHSNIINKFCNVTLAASPQTGFSEGFHVTDGMTCGVTTALLIVISTMVLWIKRFFFRQHSYISVFLQPYAIIVPLNVEKLVAAVTAVQCECQRQPGARIGKYCKSPNVIQVFFRN